MKITFVVKSANLSGGIRVVSIYADRLQKLGHEVFVVSCPPRQPTVREQLRSLLRGRGWISQPKKELSHLDKIDVPHRVIETARPVTDADVPDADVVIATWWETAEWVANLSPSKGAKAYLMQDYGFPDGIPGQKLEQIIPTWSLPLHIITIAQWLANLIHEHCGEIPVTVVPLTVDLELFNAPPRSRQESPTIGLNYRPFLIKGTDIALEAFRLASQTVPNLQLVAFGSKQPTPLFPLPQNSSYKYQATDEEIVKIYASCDAWLFSSRREGFGLPILEAMACRTPVIGTPAGVAPELLSDGAGILVKPEDAEDMARAEDAEDMARAIEKICTMPDSEWQGMSDAAYAKVTSYTWDDATALFEKALYTAIERSKKGEF
jgi:glycosyltransferase involved in cell wall biosynthesis